MVREWGAMRAAGLGPGRVLLYVERDLEWQFLIEVITELLGAD